MSLLCGEDRKEIKTGFSWIFCLGLNEKGLRFPAQDLTLTDVTQTQYCAVCESHLTKIPASELLASPNGIEGLVYGVSRGQGEVKRSGPFQGNIRYDHTLSQDRNFLFVCEPTLQAYLPRILSAIASLRAYYDFPHKDMGLMFGRVVYDPQSQTPLFVLNGIYSKDRTKYVVDPFKPNGRIDGLHPEFKDIEEVKQGIQAGKLAVHGKEKSDLILIADYGKASSAIGIKVPGSN